ncbi:MAG TPA: hybrid sensor histidine kinase/response regulator, partial [Planctomycetes bacterium]|nr:hybrid sensor histidine kinase/response regulator [Planctomycetota bacterium]
AVARRAAGRRAPRPKKIRVLVVDDSEITREVMAQVVESIGYQAIQARDGVDALERLSEAKPALVLSDLEMPRMGGRELTRQIRARPGPHLPVVIITTRGSAAERRACLDAGADAFIDKSKFRGDELVETLRRLVE